MSPINTKTDNDLKYQAIFETVMEGIITIDTSGIIINSNPAAERIFGYESHMMEGKNVSLLMPEPYRSEHSKYVLAFLNTRDAKIIGQGRTVKGVRSCGDIFDMHLAVSSVKLEEGEYFVGCIRDISEQRKAEAELALSQDRLKTSQDFGEIGTWDWDIEKDKLYWSEKTFELLGYDAALGEGQSEYHTERVLPEDQERKRQSMRNCLKTGTTYDIDYRVVYNDGTIRWVNEKGNVLRDENNQVTRMLGIIQDVTYHREYEESLKQLSDKAIQASKAKSEFLSHMSHELRTPLNAILGFAQLMEMSQTNPLNSRQTQQVNQIVDAGKHLLNLINEVLDLSSIEVGKVEFNFQKVQIQDIVDDCFSLMDPLTHEKKISLFGPTDLALEIDTDPVRFKQILINLMSNAIKYNSENGSVTVEIEMDQEDTNKFLMFIRDTGPGIDLENIDKIFLPFNRVGLENSDVIGSGIGLPLTKKIVKAMGGEIGVESEPDHGTTFWVRMDLS